MTEPIFDPAELFAQCKVRYNNKGIVDYMPTITRPSQTII